MVGPLYPPALRALASKQPHVREKITVSWDSIGRGFPGHQYSSSEDFHRRLASDVAQRLSHKMAGHLMATRRVILSQDYEGTSAEVVVHFLSHNELLELLYQAFREGQTYAMQYGPKIVPSEEGFHKACQEIGKELPPR